MLGELRNRKVGFLFPGQGSQYVGMGKTLYKMFPEVRNLYDRANEILDFDIKELSFEGPEKELRKTVNTQPAILVHSVAVSRILMDAGVSPAMAAGHSLGEYSALVAAGAMSFDDGVRLVRRRGELMFDAGTENPGTMAAILGMSASDLETLCDEAGDAGVIALANLNSPAQTVISGDVAAVDKAVALAKKRGAKKAVRLDVSGAFHSPLMSSAANGLTEALSMTKIAGAAFPVVANASADAVEEPEEIMDSLEEQLLSPVRWEESMRRMLDEGVNLFIETGPGTVLKGLMRSIERSVETFSADDADSITLTIDKVRELVESKL